MESETLKDGIRHVRQTHAEKEHLSWCGEPLPKFEWAFLDIDHATYSLQNGDWLQPCPECAKAIRQVWEDR